MVVFKQAALQLLDVPGELRIERIRPIKVIGEEQDWQLHEAGDRDICDPLLLATDWPHRAPGFDHAGLKLVDLL